jgi:transposase
MAIFKDHKIKVEDLLNVIPEALMSHLSQTTSVDYYSKVLQGKKMFYLLMYGILESDRLSQRTLEDIFNDSVFKTLFNLDQNESVRRSSISERLGKINPEYFQQIYEYIYGRFSEYYSNTEREQYNIIRVDSTMVFDTTGKIIQGMDSNKSGKKAVKYSVAFDGILPCEFKVLAEQKYASEDNALPEVVLSHVKQLIGHRNIYVLDRGLQSTRNMKDFSNQKIAFIVRTKEKRKYVELESMLSKQVETDLGELTLVIDSKVYLYTGKLVNNKRGNTHYREVLVEEPFRLIVAKSRDGTESEYWFITNDFELSAKEICDYYKRRWDIEVFFRFIKQELNTTHLISLNQNGIQVMLYMTLIVAMLVLIYKRANNIGYKTAKRRFKMEVRDLVIAMIVVQCGGDPTLFFKTKKE